jgi:large subunit ribosomal protein L13
MTEVKSNGSNVTRRVSIKKTYSAKPSEVVRRWYLIDANDTSLGRVATVAASLLLGKGKVSFTKHIDCGDFVIIVNADNLKVTGNKESDKMYHRHSSHPSGLHSRTLHEMSNVDVLRHAIGGMLPTNKLKDDRMKRLKVYSTLEHPHDPQKPVTLKIKEKK